jgi:RHS repeat-associated protein
MAQHYLNGNDPVSLNYVYDSRGRLLQLNRKDYLGTALTRQGYHFDYDAWGNTTKIYVGAAYGDTSSSLYSAIWLAEYEYNVNGTISKMTYANGDYVLYGYDSLDRLISEVYHRYGGAIETGFYYLQSRYYDPALGRFLNADSYASTGQGFLGYNMFAYCENNPVNGEDPRGEFILTAIVIGIGIGLASQYVSDVIDNHKEGKTGWDMFAFRSSWKDYLASAAGGGIAALGGGPFSSFASGAIGNVVCKWIKGDISSFDDAISYAVDGGGANFVAWGFKELAEASKVFEIDKLPRFDRKRLFEGLIEPGGWNNNLKIWSGASFSQKLKMVEGYYFVFKSGIYSTILSSGILLGKESE